MSARHALPLFLEPNMCNPMPLNLTVPDMACSACADNIIQAIRAVDSAATISADPQTKQVVVETQQTDIAIKQAIVMAGFTIV